MKFMNRRINTYRGTAADAYGDLDDVGTPYLSGVQAALAETEQESFDPAAETRRTIRTITCVVPNWADINDNDTIEDPATGNFYMIESIQAQPGIGLYPPFKLLGLRARSGVSIATD